MTTACAPILTESRPAQTDRSQTAKRKWTLPIYCASGLALLSIAAASGFIKPNSRPVVEAAPIVQADPVNDSYSVFDTSIPSQPAPRAHVRGLLDD